MSVDPSVYKEIFEDDRRGAAVLEDLIQRFARPQVNSGGIDAVLKTYERGGMRLVLDFITAQINRANGVPDENAETGE
ncbi:hypothetical protein [Achromobacter sp. NFACC18-2]|uniref:Bbp19 family protein n=1 Tax=Achromobacter sp. NFACC18-2 TaxID=1564112 RepID=UPI0008D3C2D6|nr:hypothetical protein [Achromobacter sp. NFACC18-2]SEI78757.1 hypothetical protein SAMN03159494_00997 [Achromobacter sp. NFACC18-2]